MTDTLARLQSALADRYRVDRELGAGGMATVYLAHDLRHERDVAIKVLHPDLGAALGAERFLAEIKTTAKLQHPHILPLLDSGAADGLLFYVMPFIAGETLRARLDREKVLPIAEAVRLAREAAAALDYAHRQGVVHRDIKPENILLHDGSALVADFGIALAVQQAGGSRMTQTGLSLGTPQYMSPEQAMGERTVDARSDLYALGAVTYEMLTGDPPFTGNTVQAIVAKVLTERPVAPTTVRDTIPLHVEQAVMAALAKLPADRLESAKQFAEALQGAGLPSAIPSLARGGPASPTPNTSPTWLVWTMTAVALVSTLAAAWFWKRPQSTAAADRYRMSIKLATSQWELLDQAAMAIAPDGHAVAVSVADSTGIALLRIRRLDSTAIVTVPHTEGAANITWSPDSRWIAFTADRILYRVDANGGRPERVAEVGDARTSSWISDDVIVVSANESVVLQSISLKDGSKHEFYRGATAYDVLTAVWLVGDGHHAIIRSFSATDAAAPVRFDLIEFTGLSARRVRRLETLTRSANALYKAFVPVQGRYLVRQDAELWMSAYNPETFELEGDLTPIVTGEKVGAFDVSRTGVLIYRGSPRAKSSSRLTLLNRRGEVTARLLDPADGIGFDYYGPRFSSDEQSVFYEWHAGRNSGDLWRLDLASMRTVRQTRDENHHNAFVAWAPGGKQLVFESTRSGNDLYLRDVDGPTDTRIPLKHPSGFPSDWSPDGRTILFGDQSSGGNVLATTPAGDSTWTVLGTEALEMQAVFSPDGKWIAYASDEQNHRFEIFVRRWPVTDEKWIVSTNGGEAPRWRRDGKELFFLRTQRGGTKTSVFAVDVTTGAVPRFGTEHELFAADMFVGVANLRSAVNYDVRKNGQEFIAVVFDESPVTTTPTLEVYINWMQARPSK